MFFRASGMRDAVDMLGLVIFRFDFSHLFRQNVFLLSSNRQLTAGILLIMMVDGMNVRGYRVRELLDKQNIIFRWLCYIALLLYLLICVLQNYGAPASRFIYFQF